MKLLESFYYGLTLGVIKLSNTSLLSNGLFKYYVTESASEF